MPNDRVDNLLVWLVGITVKYKEDTDLAPGRLMNIFSMSFFCIVRVFLSHLLSSLGHEKFLHFHGQECARLDRTQSIYPRATNTPDRSLCIMLCSILLFYAPDVHLKSLEGLWVDETICHVPWKAFINKLNDDWERFILFVSYFFRVIILLDVISQKGHCYSQCKCRVLGYRNV